MHQSYRKKLGSNLLNAFASSIQALNLCFITWCLCQELVLRSCSELIFLAGIPYCCCAALNLHSPKKKWTEGLMDNLLVLLSVNTKTGSGKLNLGSSTSALVNGMRVRGKGCWWREDYQWKTFECTYGKTEETIRGASGLIPLEICR